jgi:3-isopropylmalate/(R)-2-methylmalate dehydratase large subunit
VPGDRPGKVEIYLASPATVAFSALNGCITEPVKGMEYPYKRQTEVITEIEPGEKRRINGVWNYADVDNLNTDQMFAGSLTYNIKSSDAPAILPHLFKGFDSTFANEVRAGDIIIAGENFGCGSSREHPSVGLAHAGIKAVIVKSVNRIFFRSSVNQGLLLIVHPEFVKAYKAGDNVDIDLEKGYISLNDEKFRFEPLPGKLLEIIKKKGLVNWMKEQ